ncbi:MAG: iron-containing alcohol dehydrogenase [Burkholderiaceae bacterium]
MSTSDKLSSSERLEEGIHEYLAQDRVIWGVPTAQAVIQECERRQAKRVMIISSKTLNRQTDAIQSVRDALGERHVLTFDDCVEHTPRASVIAAADAAREASPDLVLTIGGGTAIDTAKVMQIAVAHKLTTPDQLEDYRVKAGPDGAPIKPQIDPAPFRQVVVPTTLGAAEFSDFGGCTDPARGVKDGYLGKTIGAATVILDPAITVHTPSWLWLSTGVRGIDHAVEGICSIQHNPLIQATCLHALRLFADALPRTKQDPNDLAARLACQQAAWLAGLGILRAAYGASHGIGHGLGAVTGMSHGYTSCVMLPHVMRFNEAKTTHAQAAIAQALGGQGSAADQVSKLIAALEMPQTLSSQNVKASEHRKVAEGAMENLWVKTNPEPISDPAQIEALLAQAQ